MAMSQTRLETEGTSEADVFFEAPKDVDRILRAINFSRIGDLALRIRDQAQVINGDKVDPGIKPAIAECLVEDVSELDDIFQLPIPAEIALTVPMGVYADNHIAKLIDDYEQSNDSLPQTGDSYSLVIPTSKITAAKALPYRSGTNFYNPVLNLRVQTSADEPLAVYNIEKLPDHVAYEPNPGRWYSLPLVSVELGVNQGQHL